MGVVLDQRGRRRGTSQHWSAHRAHPHDAVDWFARPVAARLLRQSDRRLDVNVPRLRVRFTHRVRGSQRLVETRSSKGKERQHGDSETCLTQHPPSADKHDYYYDYCHYYYYDCHYYKC